MYAVSGSIIAHGWGAVGVGVLFVLRRDPSVMIANEYAEEEERLGEGRVAFLGISCAVLVTTGTIRSSGKSRCKVVEPAPPLQILVERTTGDTSTIHGPESVHA